MKIVIPGGSGHVGRFVQREMARKGHQIVVLSRAGRPGDVRWDGKTLGPWAAELDGADAVINLAGRSVKCRYNEANKREMMASRVDSTRVVGRAIALAARPPRVWLQMSTATVYAHRFDAPHDEATGFYVSKEPGVPKEWAFSLDIADAWENEVHAAPTPKTRKVILRSALVMSPDRGGIFDVMLGLVRLGLGGSVAGGRQYVSWIHERDFLGAVEFLLRREDLEGTFIVASPEALPQRDFMAALRRAWGIPIGLPAFRWMAALGAFFMGAETELILKSRRVTPGRLQAAGFPFTYPMWSRAAPDLVAQWRAAKEAP